MNAPNGYALLGLMDDPVHGDVYSKRGEADYQFFDKYDWNGPVTPADRIEYEFFRQIPKGYQPKYQLVSVIILKPHEVVFPGDIIVKKGFALDWFDVFANPHQIMAGGYLTCAPGGYGDGQWSVETVLMAEKAASACRPYSKLTFVPKKAAMLGRITSYNMEPLPLP